MTGLVEFVQCARVERSGVGRGWTGVNTISSWVAKRLNPSVIVTQFSTGQSEPHRFSGLVFDHTPIVGKGPN